MSYIIEVLYNFSKISTILLTTHSPYILACINNLIMGYDLYDKNQNLTKKQNDKLDKILTNYQTISYDNISAYSFEIDKETNMSKTKEIKEDDFKMISFNELDNLSGVLAQDIENMENIING